MRRFRAGTLSTLIPLLALLVLALPAHAVLWCKTDPIVSLNGTQVQILVAIPAEYVPYANGPTDVTVGTPRGVDRQLLFTDPGFNGYGESVSFTDISGDLKTTTFPVLIPISVPMDESTVNPSKVPMQVTVIPSNAAPIVKSGYASGLTVKLGVTGQ